MNDLEPGCLAVIIESILGHSNGTIVQCVRTIGEHSLYGTVWKVRSKTDLMSEYGGKGREVDVPAKWLKKIRPDEVKDHEKKKEEVL